ncbi:MAG: glycosyl hydrolase [Phyllobacteriaceae bacterium]|jgi:L-iduronidase|nr:glycosyl hydrolase [Phyllobacteriaceae bacterium]
MKLTPDPSAAKPFTRFWRATGFSPGELLLTPEMQRTLKLVAATPRQGVQYLRPHFMLNLVRETGPGRYDFTLLDEAMDVMVSNGFTPFFEIMGNPSGAFDFEAEGWPERWRDLVADMTRRFVERYGADEVSSWYFESWNEPDLPWWEHGEQAFLDYYDAGAAGLDAAQPGLRIGGPGTARTLSPMFKAFVAHCDTGTNRLTGEPSRLDFISVHEKGVEKSFEDIAPDSLGIVAREGQAIDYLRAHHPRLADLPLINNECDPQVGWWQHHTWRGTAYAAAMITKIIDQHQRLMRDGDTPFDMLFNDNGFMGDWGQRTHFTLFGGRSFSKAQSEHVTDLARIEELRAAPAFSLVKKPALAVMELLAQLGDQWLPLPDLTPDQEGPGAIATRHADGTWAVLCYHSRDQIRLSGPSTITLHLPGTEDDWDVLVLALDDIAPNPFAVWEAGGHPKPPVVPQLIAPSDAIDAMRRSAEPRARFCGRVTGPVALDVEVPLPSVALVLARPADDAVPAPPNPTLARIDGLNGPEMLVNWAGSDMVGLRHDVGVARGVGEPVSVLEAPLLANAYVFSPSEDTEVFVRAVALSGLTSDWIKAEPEAVS